MDVREILDLNEEDFKDNDKLQEILSYMNINNPIAVTDKSLSYNNKSKEGE